MRCHNEYHGLNISLYVKVFEFEPHGGCSSGRFALVRVGSSSVQFGVPALELSTRTSNLNYQLELSRSDFLKP